MTEPGQSSGAHARRLGSRVLFSRDGREHLRSVVDPSVDMWLWQRQLPQLLSQSAAKLARQRIAVHTTVRCDASPSALTAALNVGGVGDRGVHLWAHELCGMLELVGAVGYRSARVRLQASARLAVAPLFHVDGTAVRLLCTYAGAGTEWLPEHGADRRQLGHRQRSHQHANARIACDLRSAKRMLPGWVAIIRAANSNAIARRRGLVHRSPSSTVPRLLLRIDPITDSRLEDERPRTEMAAASLQPRLSSAKIACRGLEQRGAGDVAS